VRHELVNGANLDPRVVMSREPKEEVACKGYSVPKLASQEPVQRHIEGLAHDVEASKLDGGKVLSAVVVKAGGRVGDFPPERFRIERIVTEEVGFECREVLSGARAAATHFPEPGKAGIGRHLNEGADESPPVTTVRVPNGRLQGHGDGGGSEVGNANPLVHGLL
jgi:hypothetical protein